MNNPIISETTLPQEIIANLDSFNDWRSFYFEHRYINTSEYLEYLVSHIKKHGFDCPFWGTHADAEKIDFSDQNYREGLLYQGLNSRLRAVLNQLLNLYGHCSVYDLKIYSPEAFTSFALALRGRYPRFACSEYIENPLLRPAFFPIAHEDLQCLSFRDATFDVVIVNDIFEHVPDINCCLREIARIVRKGGHLISTFPFNIGSQASIVRSCLKNGSIEHLMEPQYHGNPVDPQGSLVFEIPGWDILQRARNAGWGSACIVYESSVSKGIIGTGFSGIFTLLAER